MFKKKCITLDMAHDFSFVSNKGFSFLPGSTVGYSEGYVGCMRGLRVNGELRDMLRVLQNGEAFAVRPGTFFFYVFISCDSNVKITGLQISLILILLSCGRKNLDMAKEEVIFGGI